MKRISLLLVALLALTVWSTDYKTEFYDVLMDEKYEKADSILSAWETATPDDAELHSARFNYWINRAKRALVVISKDTAPDVEHLRLTDSAGNPVGSIYESDRLFVSSDSLYDNAISAIDKGIAAHPDRLDFRLGKATVQSMKDDWQNMGNTVIEILDRSVLNEFRWLNEGNVPYDNPTEVVVDAMLFHVGEMLPESDSTALATADNITQRALAIFPDNYKIVNLAGACAYNVNDPDRAFDYFRQAHTLSPDDGCILDIISVLMFNEDYDRALIYCRKIIEDPAIEDQYKEKAQSTIDFINTPVQQLKKYTYFFKWLPRLAAEIPATPEYDDVFTDVTFINTAALRNMRMASPFRDEEITSETFEIDGHKVYVLTYPDPNPEEIAICRYVAFVPSGDSYRYFTYEKSFEGRWILGSMTNDSHYNYGVADVKDASGFANLLIEKGIVAKKAENSDSETKNKETEGQKQAS